MIALGFLGQPVTVCPKADERDSCLEFKVCYELSLRGFLHRTDFSRFAYGDTLAKVVW
jgi:hypothetical protein